MPKRRREPDEAFGPMIDGTADLVTLAKQLLEPEVELPEEDPAEPEEPKRRQIVLICGDGEDALEFGKLAGSCGFDVELVSDSYNPLDEALVDLAADVHIVENYDDFVAACSVDRDHYVCIFVEDPEICEKILLQCLASDAAYVGACANSSDAALIRRELKNKGAPDAELAALCCPMGLAIGAQTPQQLAVAIVAQVLAARSGALKRLRPGD